MDPIDRTAPSVPPSPPTPDSQTGHSSRVAETGRDALAKRAAESEKNESTSPLKKGRLEQYGEFKAAFIALQTLCVTGKTNLLYNDKPFAEKCLDGLSKVYRLWPFKEKDDVEMIENYTNKISGLIEEVLTIAVSTSHIVVSDQTERDLICLVLETTPPEKMSLVPLMIFARKGALPNCSGNQGTAAAKLFYKLLEYAKNSGKCPEWTFTRFNEHLQNNPHWIDEDFLNWFFYKRHKSDLDLFIIVSSFKICVGTPLSTTFDILATLRSFFTHCIHHDIPLLDHISNQIAMEAISNEKLIPEFIYKTAIPLLTELITYPPANQEQLIRALRLFVWMLRDFKIPFSCREAIEALLSKFDIEQLREEECLFYLNLLKRLYSVSYVMQLPHSSVKLILSLFNHLQDPFKALPHLKKLCKHEWFPNVWVIMPALAQRFSRYDPTTDNKVPDENLDNLNIMCHVRTPDKLPITGQEALVQYLKSKFESNPQRLSLRLTEISVCAHLLSDPLFAAALKALLPLGAHELVPEVPAICLLEHPDAELTKMLQPVLNRYQIDAKDTYLYVLHLFAQHSHFKVTVRDPVGYCTLLCQQGNELYKLASLPTYFSDPAIRNSPEVIKFFKEILKCDLQHCHPFLILGKLAEQGSLPEGYETIVHELLKNLPLQPNALETTSEVFEALGYLTRANAFSKIALPEVLELEKWLFFPDGTRSQFYPFSPEQTQRISNGVRSLGVESQLPIPQSWIDHFIG